MVFALCALVAAGAPSNARSSLHWESGRGLRIEARGSQPAIELAPARLSRGARVVSVGKAGEAEAVEELKGDASRAELSWRFSHRPPGRGPLELELEVRGLEYRGFSAAGLHFLDAVSGRGVALSHGTWVDAAGRRTPLLARWESGAAQYVVDEATLAGTRWPAVLDPVLTPELSFDVPVSGPASESQSEPAVASDGTNTFVTWSDYRSDGSSGDVWAALLGPNNAPLRSSIRVTAGSHDERSPVVAFGQGRYLVVWHDASSGGVRGQLFATDGSPVGAELGIGFRNGHELDVAYDGSQFLVVWKETGGTTDYDIRLAQVSPAGALTADVPVVTAMSGQFTPAIGCEGGGLRRCLVAWEETRNAGTGTDIWAARVVAGAVSDPDGFVLDQGAGEQLAPAVAWDGSAFAVSWDDRRSDETAALRVATDGTVATARFVLGPSGQTALAGAAPGVLAAGTSGGALWARRLDATGAVVDAQPVDVCPACPDSASEPRLSAVTGTAPVLVWTDGRRGDSDVYAARLSSSAQVAQDGGFALVVSASGQHRPRIATDGTGYFAVWRDDRFGSVAHVVGAPVDAFGRPLIADGGVVVFSDRTPGRDYALGSPEVAWGGGRYLVVWEGKAIDFGEHVVFGRSFSPTGGLLEPAPFHLTDAGAPSESSPRLGASGSQFLLAYETQDDVAVRRLPFTGAALDPEGLRIAATTNDERPVGVAAVGDDFVVAWQYYLPNVGTVPLVGRVTSTGATPDAPAGVAVTTAQARTGYNAALACQAAGCLVAFEGGSDIRGRLFDAALSPLQAEPVVISAAEGWQGLPAVAWAGDRYRLAWEDMRNGVGKELWTADVTPSGTVTPPAGSLAVTGSEPSREPALAALGRSQSLLAYATLELGAGVDAYRVRVRAQVDTLPTDQCAGGVCIGGTPGRPGFSSTPGVFLTCSERFRYSASGAPMVTGGVGPIEWSVEPLDGYELPQGLVVDSTTGALDWTPTAAQTGQHQVVLVARGPGWAAGQLLELNVECTQREARVFCAAAPGPALLGLALWALFRALSSGAGRARSRGGPSGRS